ncbi:lysophospholipid acyltransferase family protein [Holophaga foetida]|uniref:lysophospholipid acyltransferase family protein n=1 Tax=Holophaga foetida TaxID=35839 RepID=UPI000247215D|nr:lysophospholipid acyltransferase family protein [Holophaga foetida]
MNTLLSTADGTVSGSDAFWRLARVLGLTLGRGLGSCLREPSPEDLGHWSRDVLKALGVQVQVKGAITDEAPIWVANHMSWLDPLVLLSLRPAQVLAKAEVADYPLIGNLARRHGLRFVQRESLASRTSALQGLMGAMDAGEPLLLFPEGTTTRGPRLAPLFRGGICAAFRKGVSLLPIHLSSPDTWYPWVGEAELVPHLKTMALHGYTRLGVRPGTLMKPCDFPDETAWVDAIRRTLGDAP